MTEQIPMVTNDGKGPSRFDVHEIALGGTVERMLSEQQSAENFRLRTSDSSYESGYHTAGDPTLLIILQGTIQIELRSGESREFSAGDMFIASDYLEKDVTESDIHGHKAKVLGDEELRALHLKLEKRA